jgi:hypothetical protein
VGIGIDLPMPTVYTQLHLLSQTLLEQKTALDIRPTQLLNGILNTKKSILLTKLLAGGTKDS